MANTKAIKTAVDRLRATKTLRTSGRHHIPLPTGALQRVGCRDLLVGLSRKGGVLVRLFYPADVGKQQQQTESNPYLWPNWLPHDNYRFGYADVAGIRSKFMLRLIERINGKKNVFIPVVPNARLNLQPKLSSTGDQRHQSITKYPVVVFSHGLGACRTTYSTLCIELASHGFVVAAVEHRENSACLSFYARRARYSFRDSNPDFFGHDKPDGDGGDGGEKKLSTGDSDNVGVDEVDADDEVDFGIDEPDLDPNYVPPKALSAYSTVPHLEMAWVRHRRVPITDCRPEVYRFRNRQIHHRVRECTRALDLLEALNAGYELNNILDPGFKGSEFEQMLDLDRAIIMGHSMGGATALMAAAAELRFKVAIALDPWLFPIKDESLDLITQPVLTINTETMSSSSHPNVHKMAELMSVLDGDDPDRRQAWTINGSTHFQQSDIPFTFSWPALILSGMGRCGPNRAFTINDLCCAMSLQFIAKFLDLEPNERINQYLEGKKKRLRPTLKQPKDKKNKNKNDKKGGKQVESKAALESDV